jgi:hypothetical protein
MDFSNTYIENEILWNPATLSWKPLNVPLANPLDVSDHNLKCAEIECRYSVKGHIEYDQGPLKEGVGGVSY